MKEREHDIEDKLIDFTIHILSYVESIEIASKSKQTF